MNVVTLLAISFSYRITLIPCEQLKLIRPVGHSIYSYATLPVDNEFSIFAILHRSLGFSLKSVPISTVVLLQRT